MISPSAVQKCRYVNSVWSIGVFDSIEYNMRCPELDIGSSSVIVCMSVSIVLFIGQLINLYLCEI